MNDEKRTRVSGAGGAPSREWAALEAVIAASSQAGRCDAPKRVQRLIVTGLLVATLVVVWWMGV